MPRIFFPADVVVVVVTVPLKLHSCPISRLGGVSFPFFLSFWLGSSSHNSIALSLATLPSVIFGLGHLHCWSPTVFLVIFVSAYFRTLPMFARIILAAKWTYTFSDRMGRGRWIEWGGWEISHAIIFKFTQRLFWFFHRPVIKFSRKDRMPCKWKGELQIYANIPLSNMYLCVCVCVCNGFEEYFPYFISCRLSGERLSLYIFIHCIFFARWPPPFPPQHIRPPSFLLSFARDEPILVPSLCFVRVAKQHLTYLKNYTMFEHAKSFFFLPENPVGRIERTPPHGMGVDYMCTQKKMQQQQ